MEADYVWMNGEMKPWQDAQIHVASHALHYGSGVFEGIRAYFTAQGTGIFRLREHVDRLMQSGKYYDMEIPYSVDEMIQACWQTVKANAFDSCYIRPIAYRGLGQLGVYPRNCPVDVAVLVWQWGAYLGEDGLKNGIRATISPVRRFSDDMLPTRAKATGHYLNSILAKLDAHDRGFEEAIMLNADGYLSEGSGENVFIVKDGTVFTPTVDDSILQGITRSTVVEMCEHLNIPCLQQTLSVQDVQNADEIFVTGTAAEVTPIKSVDDTLIGPPGPITQAIQKLFFDTVHGQPTAFSHYMTYN